MKTAILSLVIFFSMAACSMFGGGSKPDSGGSNSSGGSTTLGTFHPAPWSYTKDDGSEGVCNPPGGYCENDNHCHSSADKCKKK